MGLGAKLSKRKSHVVVTLPRDGDLVVRRVTGTSEQLEKAALDLAYQTGDPVVVGEYAGEIASYNEAVWRCVGRVWTVKADPLSPEAFEAQVRAMAHRMGLVAEGEAKDLVRSAWEAIDIAWKTTGTQWEEIEQAVAVALSAGLQPSQIRAQQVVLTNGLAQVIREVVGAVARMPSIAPTLGASLRLPDRRIGAALSAHHAFWVRDQYGTISTQLAAQVRPFILAGIEDGRSRLSIGADLRANMRDGLAMPRYWEIVAANATSRARSYALGSSLQAAGIQRYRWESIIDEATSETCMMLHGRVFSVGQAMATQDRILADPEPSVVQWLQPFTRERSNEIVWRFPDSTERQICTINPPGSPERYTPSMSDQSMQDQGISFPPAHHYCRSTVLPAD